jgi:hypothetical protein
MATSFDGDFFSKGAVSRVLQTHNMSSPGILESRDSTQNGVHVDPVYFRS